MQTGGVIKHENDDEGEKDGGEEVEVLRGFVEGRGVLKDTEMAGAGRHEVEPLPSKEERLVLLNWSKSR